MTEELVVIQKHYDLIMWCVPQVSKFPRSHRFVLGERIENNLYDILDGLIEAKYSRSKLDILGRLNIKIEQLRFQIRMSKDYKFISLRQYEYVSKLINEVGSLVGAWRKQQSK